MDEGIVTPKVQPHKPDFFLVVCGVIGLVATPIAWWAIQPFQVNVIHYELQRAIGPQVATVTAFSLVAFVSPYILAILTTRRRMRGTSVHDFFTLSGPMVLTLPLAIFAFSSTPPPFPFLLLAMTGAGSAAYLAGARLCASRGTSWPKLAVFSLFAFIAVLTALGAGKEHIKAHIEVAKREGATKEEVLELLEMLIMPCGAPKFMLGYEAWAESFPVRRVEPEP